jgi:alginate O-acetyltransferase complex protein AlgI
MPLFFICYFSVPSLLRNCLLMFTSLSFYSIDGGFITLVLIASIVVNYVFGLLIERAKSNPIRLAFLVAGVVLNLLPLLYYKYWNFMLSSFLPEFRFSRSKGFRT